MSVFQNIPHGAAHFWWVNATRNSSGGGLKEGHNGKATAVRKEIASAVEDALATLVPRVFSDLVVGSEGGRVVLCS